MTGLFSPYEGGAQRLLKRLGEDHPRYLEALALQTRLLENLAVAGQYGDTEVRRADRSQIMHALDELATQTAGVSFTELCDLPPSPEPPRRADETHGGNSVFQTVSAEAGSIVRGVTQVAGGLVKVDAVVGIGLAVMALVLLVGLIAVAAAVIIQRRIPPFTPKPTPTLAPVPEARTLHYYIILDASQRMELGFAEGETKWSAAQDALHGLLTSYLPSRANYGLIVLGGDPSRGAGSCDQPPQALVPLGLDTRDLVLAVSQGLKPSGEASLGQAIALARDELLKLPTGKEKAIVVITGGGDDCGDSDDEWAPIIDAFQIPTVPLWTELIVLSGEEVDEDVQSVVQRLSEIEGVHAASSSNLAQLTASTNGAIQRALERAQQAEPAAVVAEQTLIAHATQRALSSPKTVGFVTATPTRPPPAPTATRAPVAPTLPGASPTPAPPPRPASTSTAAPETPSADVPTLTATPEPAPTHTSSPTAISSATPTATFIPTPTPVPPTDTPAPSPTATPTPTPTNTPVPPPITNTPTNTPGATSCTSWEFETDGDKEGWVNGRGLSDTTARDGSLVSHITDIGPYWWGPQVVINAGISTELRIRYRIDATADDRMQLLWYIDETWDSGQWIEFDIEIDSAWHEITVDLSSRFTWQGTVTQLRLAPVGQPATSGQVEIDYIRVCPPQ